MTQQKIQELNSIKMKQEKERKDFVRKQQDMFRKAIEERQQVDKNQQYLSPNYNQKTQHTRPGSANRSFHSNSKQDITQSNTKQNNSGVRTSQNWQDAKINGQLNNDKKISNAVVSKFYSSNDVIRSAANNEDANNLSFSERKNVQLNVPSQNSKRSQNAK
ncbi:UNKNOWN [Stylonychia lemnae]|uniref:Uncharacterized protein n=1 Tax=Stylonychia lemnae TaxID=5949 RepID=A0A078AXH6_STYLE|nr:UNKNOWN [Stylonychia lemnae]|eukprot:CDW85932.1 UNKNOWN [Stylonychia lemnae]